MRKSRDTSKTVIALDPEQTMFETGSRETWQSSLITSDGIDVGPVIRQVIEARAYTIRYLVIFDIQHDRHVLHPSNAIEHMTGTLVRSSLSWDDIRALPPFTHTLTRTYEKQLYDVLGRVPYWLEEEWTFRRDD